MKFWKWFDRIIDWMAAFAGVVLIFTTLAVCYGISMRFFFRSPSIWVAQTTEYALLWMVFLGATWLLLKTEGALQRKAAAWTLWGLLWVALAALGRTVVLPDAEFLSHWGPSRLGFAVRAAAVTSLLLLGLLSVPTGRLGTPSRWTSTWQTRNGRSRRRSFSRRPALPPA